MSWLQKAARFVFGGKPVGPEQVRAASRAAANKAQANMARAALDFQQGKIGFDDWFKGMQAEIVNANGAAHALAHGGFESADDKTWKRAAKSAAKQLDYFEGFAKDVAKGRYGFPPGPGMLQRAGMYADSARAAYENERVVVEAEASGAAMAKRILGASDSCPDCIEWAELGWIDLEEMLDEYPIGASVCHSRCQCIIVVKGDED